MKTITVGIFALWMTVVEGHGGTGVNMFAGNPEIDQQNNAPTLSEIGFTETGAIRGFTSLYGCTSCYYEGFDSGNPLGEHRYHIGLQTCEDGYSPSGPCVVCDDFEGIPCDESGTLFTNYGVTVCEDFHCMPSEELFNAASLFIRENNVGALAELLVRNHLNVESDNEMQIGQKNQLVFRTCSGDSLLPISLEPGMATKILAARDSILRKLP